MKKTQKKKTLQSPPIVPRQDLRAAVKGDRSMVP